MNGLELVLVLTLNQQDFLEEIDSTYKELGIVMSFSGPVIVILTFASEMHFMRCESVLVAPLTPSVTRSFLWIGWCVRKLCSQEFARVGARLNGGGGG